MRSIRESAALVTKNRASRRWADKLGLTIAELMVGLAGGWIVTGQRRMHPVVRILINERTKLDIAAMKAKEAGA